MKKLLFIGGPMGVGKTSVAKLLQKKLPQTVYLDGDWCWFTNPWILNEETRQIALDNICYMLNNFLASKSYQNIILTWILQSDELIESITNRLNLKNVSFYNFSLIASEEAIINRLELDLAEGIRTERVVIPRSLERLEQIKKVSSIQIDTTDKGEDEVVEEILEELGGYND